MKNFILSLVGLCCCFFGSSLMAQSYVPVPVTGFNHDLIANGTGMASNSTTKAMDGVRVLYARQFNCGTSGPLGLPADGIINSIGTPGINYQLANYAENNALFLEDLNSRGTLTFQNPGTFAKLAILATSGGTPNQPTSFSVRVNFSSGSQKIYNFTVPDWCFPGNITFSRAIGNLGRVERTNCTFDNPGSSGASLYDNIITFDEFDQTRVVTSIVIQKSVSNDRTGIFAVCGITAVGSPLEVVAIEATNVAGTSFTANWEASDGATGYRLDVSEHSNFSTLVAGFNNRTIANVTSFNVTGLSLGTTYYYKVRAMNNSGISPNSNIITVTTAENQAPADPTLVTASVNPMCNGGAIQLTASGAVGTVHWFTGSCGTTGNFDTGTPITVTPTTTTIYYARNYENGEYSVGCAQLTVTVEQPAVSGSFTKLPDIAIVCEGANVSATLIAGSGGNGTDETQYSTLAGTWSDWATYVSGTNISTTGKTSVEIRTRRLAAICSASSYTPVSWSVLPAFTAGSIEQTGETICYNTAASEIGSTTPASGGDGVITYSWKSSADSYTNSIVGATSETYTPGTLTQTTSYRRYAKDGECNTEPEQSTGEWTVTVHEQLTLSCPNDFDVNTDPGACTASVSFTATVGGTPTPTLTYSVDNNPITSPYDFPKGTTTVLVNAENYCGTLTCSFTVTVNDTEYPTIVNLPQKVDVDNDEGECGAVITWTEPTSSDNCSGHSISRIAGDPSGSFFAVGTHTITYEATDAVGNKVSESFTITVTDNEKPNVICQNISIDLDATGNATITPDDIDNGTTDNCGIATMTLSRYNFGCSDMGNAIPVTLSVTDVNGNTASCTATVTVNELSVPLVRVNIRATSALNGQVKFTAYPVNGGESPTYKWFKNDIEIIGVTGNELITTCKSDDVHWVVMQSSLPCTAPAKSNEMCTY